MLSKINRFKVAEKSSGFHDKKTGSAGLVQAQYFPYFANRAQNFVNVVAH